MSNAMAGGGPAGRLPQMLIFLTAGQSGTCFRHCCGGGCDGNVAVRGGSGGSTRHGAATIQTREAPPRQVGYRVQLPSRHLPVASKGRPNSLPSAAVTEGPCSLGA